MPARWVSLGASALIMVVASVSGAENNLEIYNLSDLVAKAERIVVGDVAVSAGGTALLTIEQTLKTPPEDSKKTEAERIKRAQALLNGNELAGPLMEPPEKPLTKLKVVVGADFKIPERGSKAIFFLWEHDATAADALPDPDAGRRRSAPVYRLAHPQCLYAIEYLPQVKAALERPRSVADGRFLRAWDGRMAAKRREKNAEQELVTLKRGEVEKGLQIKMDKPVLSVRGENGFSVIAQIENSRSRPQSIYDGPAGGFGAVLVPTDPQKPALVLRISMRERLKGLDPEVLEVVETSDFVSVPGGGTLSRELIFDNVSATQKALNGDYDVSIFYSNTHDGKGLDMETAVWTGMVISIPQRLRFASH